MEMNLHTKIAELQNVIYEKSGQDRIRQNVHTTPASEQNKKDDNMEESEEVATWGNANGNSATQKNATQEWRDKHTQWQHETQTHGSRQFAIKQNAQ